MKIRSSWSDSLTPALCIGDLLRGQNWATVPFFPKPKKCLENLNTLYLSLFLFHKSINIDLLGNEVPLLCMVLLLTSETDHRLREELK